VSALGRTTSVKDGVGKARTLAIWFMGARVPSGLSTLVPTRRVISMTSMG
jgi:hypothetical protein